MQQLSRAFPNFILAIDPLAASLCFTFNGCIYWKITEILCGVLKFAPRHVI